MDVRQVHHDLPPPVTFDRLRPYPNLKAAELERLTSRYFERRDRTRSVLGVDTDDGDVKLPRIAKDDDIFTEQRRFFLLCFCLSSMGQNSIPGFLQ